MRVKIEVQERPILFNGAMVRATLADQKVVTRRVVNSDWIQSERAPIETSSGVFYFWCSGEHSCPYGRPGDRLWVREAWIADAQVDAIAPRNLSQGEPLLYPADGAMRQSGCSLIEPGKTRPSIHMPRWASRIQLEITGVRVERLQSITPLQALAEGVKSCEQDLDPDGNDYSPYELFSMLWTSINGMESWQADPWVWVVEFRRVVA